MMRWPYRSASVAATVDNGIITNATGSKATADFSVPYPSTSWRYCNEMKKNPKIAKNCKNNDADPVAKPCSLNSRGSRSGVGVRSSQRTNKKPATTPPMMPASETGSLQPRLGPSMMPSTSPPTASTERMVPSGSRPTCSPSRVSGTVSSVAISAAAARTALTTKIAPHHHCSSSAPPTSMPRMPPAPANPAHTPTAFARPSGGNTLVIVDNVPGMINAAPTPVTTRQPISAPEELLNAEAALANPKIEMPSTSARRRPNRSPIAPAGRSSAANATV